MEIDTAQTRAVGAELEMIALGWLGAAMAGEPVGDLQGAFGTSALGAQTAEALRTFTRRAQTALGELAGRTTAAGRALATAADRFDAVEDALAMRPS